MYSSCLFPPPYSLSKFVCQKIDKHILKMSFTQYKCIYSNYIFYCLFKEIILDAIITLWKFDIMTVCSCTLSQKQVITFQIPVMKTSWKNSNLLHNIYYCRVYLTLLSTLRRLLLWSCAVEIRLNWIDDIFTIFNSMLW